MVLAEKDTDTTGQRVILAGQHYLQAEKPFGLVMGDGQASSNTVAIGGGRTTVNAATNLHFYTAADNTTPTGSVRMMVDSAGRVSLGPNTTTPTTALHVYDDGSGTRVDGDSTIFRNSFHFNGGTNLTNGTLVFQEQVSGARNNQVSTFFRTQVIYNGDGTTRRGDVRMGVAVNSGFGAMQLRLTQTPAQDKILMFGSNVESYDTETATDGTYTGNSVVAINSDGTPNKILRLDVNGVTQFDVGSSGDITAAAYPTTRNDSPPRNLIHTGVNGEILSAPMTLDTYESTNGLILSYSLDQVATNTYYDLSGHESRS
jgi:hypothetical protein